MKPQVDSRIMPSLAPNMNPTFNPNPGPPVLEPNINTTIPQNNVIDINHSYNINTVQPDKITYNPVDEYFRGENVKPIVDIYDLDSGDKSNY